MYVAGRPSLRLKITMLHNTIVVPMLSMCVRGRAMPSRGHHGISMFISRECSYGMMAQFSLYLHKKGGLKPHAFIHSVFPSNKTRRLVYVVLLLGQRQRRWSVFNAAQSRRIVFAGM